MKYTNTDFLNRGGIQKGRRSTCISKWEKHTQGIKGQQITRIHPAAPKGMHFVKKNQMKMMGKAYQV